MARRETVRVEGLKELDQALAKLRDDFNVSNATGKNLIRRALTAGAEPIESVAEALAPYLRGHLKRSITIGRKLTRRQKREHKPQSAVEIFVGPSGLPQAITQEFGTYKEPAQPFMRPAWDGKRMEALQRITKALAEQIEKTRTRAARKAERLAAKIRANG